MNGPDEDYVESGRHQTLGEQLHKGAGRPYTKTTEHKRQVGVAKAGELTTWQTKFMASIEKRLADGFALTGKQATILLELSLSPSARKADPDVPQYDAEGMPMNKAADIAAYGSSHRDFTSETVSPCTHTECDWRGKLADWWVHAHEEHGRDLPYWFAEYEERRISQEKTDV